MGLHLNRPVLFLLGAGFNVDAAFEAGNPIGTQFPIKYPVVSDLLKKCFHRDSIPANKSIEDLFQDSIDEGNREPIKNLYDTLMEADYYISVCLTANGNHWDNVYMRFLDDFPKSHIMTFNYDSLPEILLLSRKLWRPEDGYGIPVKVKMAPVTDSFRQSLPSQSQRVILHLHGSLCLYPDEFFINYQENSNYGVLHERKIPEYIFDPDTIGHRFVPFDRVHPSESYRYKEERVIAPVPNKAEELKSKFVREIYQQAIDLICDYNTIVVIGYSFNITDSQSYSVLLKAAANKNILVVSPNADCIVQRLKKEYPNIHWNSEVMSFRQWVLKQYPGI